MIPIKNIYYMLSYAFQILKEQGYKDLATEEFENGGDLCAAILIKGITAQVKRGLEKEYINQTEPLATLRGKIDISASIKGRAILRRKLVCSYDEFSVNSYFNRIIKTTMEVLIKSDIDRERKKQLRKLRVYFVGVQTLRIENINWKIKFNKNNQSYQMLIFICYLVIKGLLHTNDDGTTRLMDFFDEQRMCRLYEKFILEYYRKERPNLNASASQIPWDIDGEDMDMLPIMQSDIMLRKGEKTLIIDAKYYSSTTQNYYNTNTLHSANLYQIYTYVKNYDVNKTGQVSGLVLYAKTDELILPNKTYQMAGNTISVKTLDLDCEFEKIKEQLEQIENF